jgi:UDP-N-acetylglucosamine 1-carboxyvinyltransferase
MMIEVLRSLGAEVEWDERGRLHIEAAHIHTFRLPLKSASRIRGSFLTVGPMLARYGRIEAPRPGGCAIGKRPVSVDVKGFARMGAEIEAEDRNGYYIARTNRLRGCNLVLDYPSHTGTENLLMAACLAEGTTIIENASVEPEVRDLAEFLRSMGASITEIGTGTIQVEGVSELCGITYHVMPDRIEAGTFALAGAITGGRVILEGVIPHHLDALTAKLIEAGVKVTEEKDSYAVEAGHKLGPVDIQTFPYPGFPTDLQAPFGALMTQAHGQSTIRETMYEDRLTYVGELQKMGAHILVDGQTAVIDGPTPLRGTRVKALDIRAGAAVMLAGLAAPGETVVAQDFQVDRGYERIDEKLARLGAHVRRLN